MTRAKMMRQQNLKDEIARFGGFKKVGFSLYVFWLSFEQWQTKSKIGWSKLKKKYSKWDVSEKINAWDNWNSEKGFVSVAK